LVLGSKFKVEGKKIKKAKCKIKKERKDPVKKEDGGIS
jgi:hypothetical protein